MGVSGISIGRSSHEVAEVPSHFPVALAPKRCSEEKEI
jgi:hypothetical protein